MDLWQDFHSGGRQSAPLPQSRCEPPDIVTAPRQAHPSSRLPDKPIQAGIAHPFPSRLPSKAHPSPSKRRLDGHSGGRDDARGLIALLFFGKET